MLPVMYGGRQLKNDVIFQMKSIYFDYNLFNHLQIVLENVVVKNGFTDEQKKDHKALINIWKISENSDIEIITCEDDCLMEFANYDPSIDNYSKIEDFLSSTPKMLSRFNLFKKVSKGKLLIGPFGEYGFGRGPFCGGPKENYTLLNKICYMLNISETATPQRERDARHIMHSILYNCLSFVTMDYKLIKNYTTRYPLIKDFLDQNGYIVNIVSPTELLENI